MSDLTLLAIWLVCGKKDNSPGSKDRDGSFEALLKLGLMGSAAVTAMEKQEMVNKTYAEAMGMVMEAAGKEAAANNNMAASTRQDAALLAPVEDNGGTEGGSPDPQNGSSKEKGQTWYYMYRVTGGTHAMAYDPKNKVVYDINSWRDENKEEIPAYKRFAEHPLEPLSVAYQYRMNITYEWTMLSEREAGNKWALCPINVPDPAAATAWFQSHTGKGWEYSAGFNNCSIYAMEGLAAGGAKIYHVGLSPAPSSVNSKPTIWQFRAKQ